MNSGTEADAPSPPTPVESSPVVNKTSDASPTSRAHRTTPSFILLACVILFVVFLIGDRVNPHPTLSKNIGGEVKVFNHSKSAAAPPVTQSTYVSDNLVDGCKPQDCRSGGGELFGTYLGEHKGVIGYSNCFSKTCISYENHVLPPLTGVHVTENNFSSSGMKWQCVEYARRYWMLQGTPEPALFGDVDGAEDIWFLDMVTLLRSQQKVPLLKMRNGAGELPNEHATGKKGGNKTVSDEVTVRNGQTIAPQEGDLLIYPREETEFPYGHVAVITQVDMKNFDVVESSATGSKRRGTLLVAEQNWDNKVWVMANHSRKMTLEWIVTKGGMVVDHHIADDDGYTVLGWVRPGTGTKTLEK